MSRATPYDLAVLGLGAVGSMAAWRAAARGARVVGFEQFDLAHDRGSSHGGSRIFRQTLFEGVEYVPLVKRALPLWQELERAGERGLFQRSGGLCIGPRDSALIATALNSARVGEFEHHLLDEDELTDRYPQHARIPGDVAVLEPHAGILNPEECIKSAVELAKSHGADLAFGTRIVSISHDDSSVRITTENDEVEARRAIVSTGAWFTDLLGDLDLPLGIVRSPLVWFTGRDRAAYRPDRFPVFIRKTGDIDGWGISDVDGTGVKVGAGPSAPKPWLDHAEDNAYPIDDRDTGPPEEYCAKALPGLNPAHVAAKPCMNSRTDDRDFVLGVSRHAPSLVLAGGFSGHGFKHATGSADVLVDLALEGTSDVPLDKFSPDRFSTAVTGAR